MKKKVKMFPQKPPKKQTKVNIVNKNCLKKLKIKNISLFYI